MKTILALDSSGKTASVCVKAQGRVLFDEVIDEGLTHSETLLALVRRALAASRLQPEDISLYVVTAGPGSFTGLRIGMALIKGLAFAHGTPAVAVSTLHALACAYEGLPGTLVTALDARRSEVYWAAFAGGDAPCRLAPDSTGPLAQLAPFVEGAKGPVYFVGDGAPLCYEAFGANGKVCRLPGGSPPSIARGAAEAAGAAEGATEAGALRPVYLRLSQAERQRAEKMAGEL